jgi:hypothetical protein
MKQFMCMLLAGVAAMAVSPGFAQQAQHPIEGAVYCGGRAAANTMVPANDVSTCEVSPLIATAGNALQLVRQRTLVFGQIPRPAVVGWGMAIDYDASAIGPAMNNVRYEYNPDFRIPAAREVIQPEGGDAIVHVIKGNRAWDEGPQPGFNPVDVASEQSIAMRQARIWLNPHGIIAAAAFTEKGLCPTARNSPASDPAKCPDHKVSIEGDKTINVTLYGFDYVVTLGEDNRPATISTTVNGVEMVASYASYRDGAGMGGQPTDEEIQRYVAAGDLDSLANASGPLDKYRVGLYYPEEFTLTVGGITVLDIDIKQGWTGKYVIFPDPELLAG